MPLKNPRDLYDAWIFQLNANDTVPLTVHAPKSGFLTQMRFHHLPSNTQLLERGRLHQDLYSQQLDREKYSACHIDSKYPHQIANALKLQADPIAEGTAEEAPSAA